MLTGLSNPSLKFGFLPSFVFCRCILNHFEANLWSRFHLRVGPCLIVFWPIGLLWISFWLISVLFFLFSCRPWCSVGAFWPAGSWCIQGAVVTCAMIDKFGIFDASSQKWRNLLRNQDKLDYKSWWMLCSYVLWFITDSLQPLRSLPQNQTPPSPLSPILKGKKSGFLCVANWILSY